MACSDNSYTAPSRRPPLTQDLARARELDNVPDREEVIGVLQLLDERELMLELLAHFRRDLSVGRHAIARAPPRDA